MTSDRGPAHLRAFYVSNSAYDGAAVVSRILMGWLSDMYSPHILGSASSFSASACVFLLWGVAGRYLPAVFVFAIAFGCAAGGYSSLWSVCIRTSTLAEALNKRLTLTNRA